MNINSIEDEDLKIILDIQKNMGLKHRIGTRGFLAPEIIFNSKIQSKAVDVWAAGVILLSFFAKRMPVFNLNKFSKINDDSIKELEPLIIVFGRDKVIEIAQKFRIILINNFYFLECLIYIPDIFNKYTLAKDLETMIERNDINEDGIDLLRRMMELDPEKRITAEQAKKHKFFNDII
jgi:cell division control protein 7